MRREGETASGGLLVVDASRVPGHQQLAAARADADAIAALHPGARVLRDEAATVDAVRAALTEHSSIHFSCHASHYPDAPSRSGLLLHDGYLAIGEIDRIDLPSAATAFLAACRTAQGTPTVADEAINPATSMLLAGFRNVIGTLWPVSDETASAVSLAFYGDSAESHDPALALHRAVRRAQDAEPLRPDLWSGFVHAGP